MKLLSVFGLRNGEREGLEKLFFINVPNGKKCFLIALCQDSIDSY